jgi:hypothetical protein
MSRLNDFILEVPYLFLMKVPYLWLPVVVFYTWPPVVSLILSGIILLGLLAMNWQNSAWIEKVRRDFTHDPDSLSVETVRPLTSFVLRNSLLLLALSAAIGWLLNGYLGFGGLQWGLFAGGIIALYKKAIFFGRRVTYIFTDRGISIRYVPGHLDYRLLIRFDEIQWVRRVQLPDNIPVSWTVIAPTGQPDEGLLLSPRNGKGFSAQFEQILLGSNDLELLAKKFPSALIVPD